MNENHGARSAGIELLRVISMYLVVVLHVLGQGGVMVRVSSHPGTYYACWFLEAAALCAVNCYGLISGYVGVYASFRPKRLLRLYLQVWFWSAGIAFLFFLIRPDVFAGMEIPDAFSYLPPALYHVLHYVMPFSFKNYWYFSAYVGLFVLSPLLSAGIRELDERSAKHLLMVLFLVFSLATMVPKVFGIDPLEQIGGYSLMWLVVLYVMGGCVRRLGHVTTKKQRWLWALVFAGCALGSAAYKIGMENLTRTMLGQPMYARLLVTYHAPTMVLCATSLLMICKDLPISGMILRKAVLWLSPVSFSVYLIHTHPLIWEHLLLKAFVSYRSAAPWQIFFLVPLTALCIYLGCSLAGWGYRLLDRGLRMMIDSLQKKQR